ncbi:unnamed protein product, partial [Ectocarpus sp. 6 AP-2014]
KSLGGSFQCVGPYPPKASPCLLSSNSIVLVLHVAPFFCLSVSLARAISTPAQPRGSRCTLDLCRSRQLKPDNKHPTITRETAVRSNPPLAKSKVRPTTQIKQVLDDMIKPPRCVV